jgi:hypothetical protein
MLSWLHPVQDEVINGAAVIHIFVHSPQASKSAKHKTCTIFLQIIILVFLAFEQLSQIANQGQEITN